MLTTLKPSWPARRYEEDFQRVILPLKTSNTKNVNSDDSLNKSTMKSLQESRRILLENLQNTTHNSAEPDDHRKKRKISFKTKNSSGTNRRITPNSTTTLSASKVQQLTVKFNELIHDQPKMVEVIRRANSVKVEQNRKPLIRPKPSRIEDKKRPSVKRKASVKKILDDKTELRNSVKDTIQIFERRKTESGIVKSPEKPRIPEKNICKTKELVIKDGVKKFKILPNDKTISNLTDYFENKVQNKTNTTVNEELSNNETNTRVQILKSPHDLPTKKATKSLYETLNLTKTTSSTNLIKMVTEENQTQESVKPNNSFLWRSRSRDSSSFNIYTSIEYEDNHVENKTEYTQEDTEHAYEDTGQEKDQKFDEIIENLYDTVDPLIMDEYKVKYEQLLAKTDEILKDFKTTQPSQDNISIHSYESFYNKTEKDYSENTEDIYETLSIKNEASIINKITQKPLPSLPDICSEYYPLEIENIYSTLPSTPSELNSTQTISKIEVAESSTPEEDIYSIVKDPYEKIYNNTDKYLSYESILPLNLGKGDNLSSCGSNRGSILSCDQQSNSLYGRYAPGSDHSSTDRSGSDDWVDISDIDEEIPGFVVIREKQKLNKKNSGWSNKVRDQWIKSPKKTPDYNDALSDSYHYYESLHSDEDFDSFDSESDDDSFHKINPNDSGVEMGLSQLPDPPRDANNPGGNIYGLTRLAARLRKNWSLTKNDISKSLSRMTKKKTVVGDGGSSGHRPPPPRPPPPLPTTKPRPVSTPVLLKAEVEFRTAQSYQNVEFQQNKQQEDIKTIKTSTSTNSMGRKKNWLKFRRAVSMGETSSEDVQPALQVYNAPSHTKSTFYLPNETEVEQEEKPQVPARRRAPRPQSPPPPAPVGCPTQGKTSKEKLRSTSWYAECGLFKSTDLSVLPSDVSPTNLTPQRSSSTCWYAEVGLYQPKNKSSVSSCSENSGKDVQNNAQEVKIYSPRPDLIPNSKFYLDPTQEDLESYYNIKNQNYYNSDSLKRSSNDKMATLLRDEPLYQFYDAAVAENALNESSSDSEYDGYEEIGELLAKEKEQIVCEETIVRTSVRTRLQGCRTLWCEIPEVLQSEILRTLTTTQRKLQEAKFEILTSEGSYLNSLNVLTDHFIPKLSEDNLTSEEDRKILFGNIFAVKQCSEKLLNELEACWQDSILLPNICNIIQKYCQDHFSVYIQYCASQTLSDAVLRKCRGETSPKSGKSPNFTRFGELVKRLEASSACQGLSLHSFLMLPMQRVTRLPLLLDAVLRRLAPSDDEFPSCQAALRALHDIATRCNEAARHTERLCELQRLQGQLEFPGGVPVVELVAEGCKRFLVRSGDLTQLLARGGAKAEEQGIKLTFGKRFTKQMVTVMLFEDWVIIARRKHEDTLTVLHHCPRSFLELSPPDTPPPTMDSALLLFLTLLENQDGKQISLLLSCNSETEKTRWLEALRPPQAEDPNETIYESWDCPQVQAVHHYEPIQPDELSLKRGDVVNVNKKMKDGWYHGERLRDGQSGWFPGNHSVEIANPHVRARNLRQRYRLLAYTDEFLNSSSKS